MKRSFESGYQKRKKRDQLVLDKSKLPRLDGYLLTASPLPISTAAPSPLPISTLPTATAFSSAGAPVDTRRLADPAMWG